MWNSNGCHRWKLLTERPRQHETARGKASARSPLSLSTYFLIALNFRPCFWNAQTRASRPSQAHVRHPCSSTLSDLCASRQLLRCASGYFAWFLHVKLNPIRLQFLSETMFTYLTVWHLTEEFLFPPRFFESSISYQAISHSDGKCVTPGLRSER